MSYNGIEAIKIAYRSSNKPTMVISHFDLATSLHHLISNNTGKKLFNYILGYKERTRDKLDIQESLNIVTDI